MDSKMVLAAVLMTAGAITAMLMVYNVFLSGMRKYTAASPKIEATSLADRERESAQRLREINELNRLKMQEQNDLNKLKMQEQNESNKLKMQEEQADRLLDKFKRY